MLKAIPPTDALSLCYAKLTPCDPTTLHVHVCYYVITSVSNSSSPVSRMCSLFFSIGVVPWSDGRCSSGESVTGPLILHMFVIIVSQHICCEVRSSLKSSPVVKRLRYLIDGGRGWMCIQYSLLNVQTGYSNKKRAREALDRHKGQPISRVCQSGAFGGSRGVHVVSWVLNGPICTLQSGRKNTLAFKAIS